MRIGSIRGKLVVSYVLLTALTAGLVGVLSLSLLQAYIRQQTESRLESNAQAIAEQAYPLLASPLTRIDQLQELAQTTAFLGNVRVQILSTNLTVLVDSGTAEQSTAVLWLQSDPAETHQPGIILPLRPRQGWAERLKNERVSVDSRDPMIIRIDEGPWGRNVFFEPNPWPSVTEQLFPTALSGNPERPDATANQNLEKRWVQAAIGNPKEPIGYVRLGSPPESSTQVLAAMSQALLLAGIGAAVIAALAGLLVGRGLTAPILALADSANRMSSGDLNARAPEIRQGGEIGQLAQQFNHMAKRLQASFQALSAERDALRRFIADASHELRTPVTALSNFIELLQGPAAEDPAARAEFLTESQAQVRRMEWITTNLLDLSRLDAGLVQLDRRPQDLGDLLQSAAAPFLPAARERGVILEIQPPQQPVSVVVDQARMEVVLSNLLDNALKFTTAGGRVVLRGAAAEAENEYIIQVEDNGSGIPAEELPHIFERFYRGQASWDGSGLGLAIVQSIVQAHGGQVQVESRPGGGSLFTIKLR